MVGKPGRMRGFRGGDSESAFQIRMFGGHFIRCIGLETPGVGGQADGHVVVGDARLLEGLICPLPLSFSTPSMAQDPWSIHPSHQNGAFEFPIHALAGNSPMADQSLAIHTSAAKPAITPTTWSWVLSRTPVATYLAKCSQLFPKRS